MGLTISVMIPSDTKVRSSYTYFNRFRELLAEASGTNLKEKVGYGGKLSWSGEEPFYEILDHPDNEGEIWEIEELVEDFDNKEHKETFIKLIEELDMTQYIQTWNDWVWMLAVAETEGGMLHFG